MPLRVFTELEDSKQRLHDERWIGKWSEFDEPDPTGEHGQQICSHLESKAGLSRAARAGQRNHPMFCDQLSYFIDLFFTSNEGRQLRREIMVEEVQRLERRKFGGQVRHCQLIELLWVEDIL